VLVNSILSYFSRHGQFYFPPVNDAVGTRSKRRQVKTATGHSGSD